MSDDVMMSLLACPLSPDIAGSVWLYRLPDKIEPEWQRLRGQYRAVAHTDGNLPYSGLLTVLRASGNTSATLWPSSKAHPPRILALSKRLSAAHLRFAVVLWEQALLGVKPDSMALDHPSTLADLFASVEPEQTRTWDHIRLGPRAVDADGWVFDAVNSNVTARLAAHRLNVDGLEIPLRADCENNLVVWNPEFLWSNTWHAASSSCSSKTSGTGAADLPEWKTRRYRAALRIDVAMKSVHALPVPLLTLRPHVSRLSSTISSARSGWLAPRSPHAPLLNIALGGTGKNTHLEHTSRLALDAWVRLKDEPVFPRGDDSQEFLPAGARDLSGEPGNFRVLVPFSTAYPIGRSVGIHTVAALADHLETATGQNLLRARQVVKTLGIGTRQTDNGRDAVLLDDASLDEIMHAAGCSRLRILALYQHQDTRTRMQRLLAYHFNRPELADRMPEDEVVALGCRAEVLFHHAPALLAHGDHAQRPGLVADLPGLQADDTGVLALVETEYDAKQWRKDRRDAAHNVEGAVDPYLIDAKPKVSRLLARHGVLAQFITKPKKKKRPAPATEEAQPTSPLSALGLELKSDHAGHNAIGDMLRAAGMVHPRLTRAISHRGGLQHCVAHVGLHLREQRGAFYKKRTDRPSLMWILTAFVPVGEQWTTLAYVPPNRHGAGGWHNYAWAQAISRQNPIPEGSRSESELPRRIDQALLQLHDVIGTTGYVLYLSGDSTRSVWPLLSNKNADLLPDEAGHIGDRPALPGATLESSHRPRAIIRTTSSKNPNIPVPATFHTVDDLGTEAPGPRTSNALFQLDGSASTYFMSRLPLQATGGTPSAKLGRKNSRWTAAGADQAENWHCLTSTEIAVIDHPADEDPLPYAVTAARLCTHALAWLGRTQHPLPVHAAIQMDMNHPDYRRTVDSDDENGL
ncbi:RNaseH domain-containing protein [Streptomyces sp. NPDC048305]|uniref:RNaseH domain-containing protein n=1 Tax=Streptomyces sp. NPDC048305 TaxID=3365532 RepID=UPI003719C766